MGFIAITFLVSTIGLLVATAWEAVHRTFSSHFGRGT